MKNCTEKIFLFQDIIRPPVGLKGQEVAFPVESQNQTLTPATIVDVHIEGELSRSFGLIDTSQPSQTSSFYKKSQEISCKSFYYKFSMQYTLLVKLSTVRERKWYTYSRHLTLPN